MKSMCKCIPDMRSYACDDPNCIHNPNHFCDEDGVLYIDQKGNEYKFRNHEDAEAFREKNQEAINIVEGSVCCSICGKISLPF